MNFELETTREAIKHVRFDTIDSIPIKKNIRTIVMSNYSASMVTVCRKLSVNSLLRRVFVRTINFYRWEIHVLLNFDATDAMLKA